MKKILLLLTVIAFHTSYAHEGHNETPGAFKAIHGGTVLTGKEINLEYLTSGTEVKMYPVSHEGDTLNPLDVKLSATAKVPKGKAETVKLESKDGAYVGNVDLKKSHRAEVLVTTEIKGKKDTFKFQVEK